MAGGIEAATQAMMGKVAHPATVALKGADADERDAVRRAYGVEEIAPLASLASASSLLIAEEFLIPPERVAP